MSEKNCPICSGATEQTGSKQGEFKKDQFFLNRCTNCQFTFVVNPWTDYAAIYSDDYYAGKGADPLVDYFFELDHAEKTIRNYEWRGIVKTVSGLVALKPETRWLDYGCGNAGLVRYGLENKVCQIMGYDEGAIIDRVKTLRIPVLNQSELEQASGSFDVITAIEVLEHIADPIAFLKQIKSLLKPGGLFFLTTGNAKPFRKQIEKWSYVVPEVHISFFEPETLCYALRLAGFRPQFIKVFSGYSDIIRYKVLKSLRIRERLFLERMLPWFLLSRIIDWRYGVSKHPIGWAQ